MKVIQPNCRVQFTAEDIDFIVTALGKKPSDAAFLTQLFADPSARDLILDDEKLFHALLEQRGCLRVSSHFYFYVLVRTVLHRSGIDDRGVADYVAEVLTEFSLNERLRCTVASQQHPMEYFFEMLAALQQADDRTTFCIRTHMGNHSLFLSGVFPERIRFRAERRGFPDLKYYEQLGRTSFRVARDHRLAQQYELAQIFDVLSERFEPARRALNDLADRIFSFTDCDASFHALMTQKE
jgi:hypothetical protein